MVVETRDVHGRKIWIDDVAQAETDNQRAHRQYPGLEQVAPGRLARWSALARAPRQHIRPVHVELIRNYVGRFNELPTYILEQRDRSIDRFLCMADDGVLPGVALFNA